MYIYICVYMHAYMHIYIYIHTYIHTYIWIFLLYLSIVSAGKKYQLDRKIKLDDDTDPTGDRYPSSHAHFQQPL